MASSDAERRVTSGAAWEEFCRSLEQAGRVITAEDSPRDLLDRAEGYRYLSRLVRAGLEGFLEDADPRGAGAARARCTRR